MGVVNHSSRTRGSGKKAKRGKGLRGGVGRAGSFDHKKTKYIKEKENKKKLKKTKKFILSLKELKTMYDHNVFKEDGIIDLDKLGVFKLIGTGPAIKNMKLKGNMTEKAKKKLIENNNEILS